MSSSLAGSLVDEALIRWPVPLADAVAALAASAGPHERRDRVVEVFRTALRLVAGLTLAARVQYGANTGDPDQVSALLRSLRSRGLTDGQWVGLTRELLRPWAEEPDAHPLPELVRLLHGQRAFTRAVDGLLAMRKNETVAHGATGDADEIEALLAKRVPQLASLLERLAPLWSRLQIAVPLADGKSAWRLTGSTPPRGRWRLRQVSRELEPGRAVLLDAAGTPVLLLHPLMMMRRPTPAEVEELFFLDGRIRRQTRYVALPSMAELRTDDVWATLAGLFDEDGPAEEGPAGVTRPYRGLAPFGAEHGAVFFGRETQAVALANRVRAHAWVTVTGASGSGKSSLVHAGVLPLLEGFRPVTLRPGTAPMVTLRQALRPWLTGGEDPEVLGMALDARCVPTGERLVLVVDQGEELLTLAAPEQREPFGKALASLAGATQARVVYCLREDFFGRLGEVPPLRGLYTWQVEVVMAPDRAALQRILVGPAHAFGYVFEDGLVEEMVKTVAAEPAALALLQFCADQLWERRDRSWKRLTREAYTAVGGVAGALATHAEAVLSSLTPGQHGRVRELMRRLITPERTRAVVPREELESTSEHAGAVLDRLIDARLLTVRDSETGPVIELVHEALLAHWDRLRSWQDEDRAGQRTLHAIRQAARQWNARGQPHGLLWRGEALDELQVWLRQVGPAMLTQDEARFAEACVQAEQAHQGELLAARARRTRNARLVGGAGLALAALFGGLAWVALQARNEAEQQRTRVEAEALATRNAVRLAVARDLLDPTDNLAVLREVEGEVLDASWRELAWTALQRRDVARLSHTLGDFDFVGGFPLRAPGEVLWLASTGQARRVDLLEQRVTPVTLPANGAAFAYHPDANSLYVFSRTNGLHRVTFPDDAVKIEVPEGLMPIAHDDPPMLVSVERGETPEGGNPRLHRRLRAFALRGDRAEPLVDFGFRRSGSLLAVHPDGDAILATDWRYGDAACRVWSVPTDAAAEPLALDGHTWQAMGGCYLGDEHIVTTSTDKTVRVWDAATGDEVQRYALEERGSKIACHPDGRQFVVADFENRVFTFSLDNGLETAHTTAPLDTPEPPLFYSPDGTWLLQAGMSGTLRLYPDAGHGPGVDVHVGEAMLVNASFTADGSQLVVMTGEGRTRRWTLDDLARPAISFDAAVVHLRLSPDGSRLVVRLADGRIFLAPTDPSHPPILLTTGGRTDYSSFSTDGALVAVTGLGRTQLFDAGDGSLRGVLDGRAHRRGEPIPVGVGVPREEHISRRWSPDYRGVVEKDGKELRVAWVEAETGQRHPLVEGWPTASSRFSPDGSLLALTPESGPVQVWRLSSPPEHLRDVAGTSPTTFVAFSHDNRHIAWVSADSGVIEVAQTEGDAPPAQHDLGKGPLAMLIFSRDGRISAATQRGESLVLDVETGAVRALPHESRTAGGATFDTDGRWILLRDLFDNGVLFPAEPGLPVVMVEHGRGLRGGYGKLQTSADFRTWARVLPDDHTIEIQSLDLDLYEDDEALMEALWARTDACLDDAYRSELLGVGPRAAAEQTLACRERVLDDHAPQADDAP